MREIEGFEYIRLMNTIEGIDIPTFEKICKLKEGESFDNYTLKMKLSVLDKIDTNGLFLFDSSTNQRIMVECVRKYYDINSNCNTCGSIITFLDNDNLYEFSNCSVCHLCALKANKLNKLKKIN